MGTEGALIIKKDCYHAPWFLVKYKGDNFFDEKGVHIAYVNDVTKQETSFLNGIQMLFLRDTI